MASTAAALWSGYAPVEAAAAKDAAKPAPVIVQTAAAARSTVPEYMQGLGNVVAFNTVIVTARVDGQLDRVAFTEGQEVKKGDLLAQLDPRPLQAALGSVIAAQAKDAASLQSAQLDLERYAALMPQKLIAQQTLDQQKATVAQLTASVQADRAAVDNARTQLSYARITSPISGRTGIRRVDPGNIVRSTDTNGIVTVTQVQPIAVVFTLPEDALPSVTQAMAAGAVAVTALSRDNQTVLDTGTVALIDNEIDTTTGTMKLKATFPNAKKALWPGQFVNARVLLGKQEGAITVPTAAIQRGPSGLFVYVVNPDLTVVAGPVTAGVANNGVTVITQGLAAGEPVVTANQYRLQPGTSVRVNNNPPTAAPAVTPPVSGQRASRGSG